MSNSLSGACSVLCVLVACAHSPNSPRVLDAFGTTDYVWPWQEYDVPHTGVDLEAPEGSAVIAVSDGLVVAVSHDERGASVQVEHGRVGLAAYVHLRDPEVIVGQTVRRGDALGYVWAPPRDEWVSHLHFAVCAKKGCAFGLVEPMSLLWGCLSVYGAGDSDAVVYPLSC